MHADLAGDDEDVDDTYAYARGGGESDEENPGVHTDGRWRMKDLEAPTGDPQSDEENPGGQIHQVYAALDGRSVMCHH